MPERTGGTIFRRDAGAGRVLRRTDLLRGGAVLGGALAVAVGLSLLFASRGRFLAAAARARGLGDRLVVRHGGLLFAIGERVLGEGARVLRLAGLRAGQRQQRSEPK